MERSEDTAAHISVFMKNLGRCFRPEGAVEGLRTNQIGLTEASTPRKVSMPLRGRITWYLRGKQLLAPDVGEFRLTTAGQHGLETHFSVRPLSVSFTDLFLRQDFRCLRLILKLL